MESTQSRGELGVRAVVGQRGRKELCKMRKRFKVSLLFLTKQSKTFLKEKRDVMGPQIAKIWTG